MGQPTKLFLQMWRKLQLVAFLVASPKDLLLQRIKLPYLRIKLPYLFPTRIDVHRYADRELVGSVCRFLIEIRTHVFRAEHVQPTGRSINDQTGDATEKKISCNPSTR